MVSMECLDTDIDTGTDTAVEFLKRTPHESMTLKDITLFVSLLQTLAGECTHLYTDYCYYEGPVYVFCSNHYQWLKENIWKS
jgi:hypothetical protein